MADDCSKYVQRQASGTFRYYRRVPLEVLEKAGGSPHVRKSLKTKDHREALERAAVIHKATNALWASIASSNDNQTTIEQYERAVAAAQSLGFTYRPLSEIVHGPYEDVAARLEAAHKHASAVSVVRGVTGTAPSPEPRVNDIWELYEKYNAAGLTGMSPRQMSKHKISRERAIRYLSDALDNAKLSEITRADVLRYRDWWTDKISSEKLKAYSANRSFSDIKGMLTVVDDALKTTYREPWDKVRLRETNATKLKKRLQFPPEWVSEKILAEGALADLNEDARFVVFTMIETGARLGEICNLRPEDIRLDVGVPHIAIADRADRRQKTDHSIRQVPLVGVALWAMKQRPNGFQRYADKADSASAVINKVMKSAGLRPSDRHTAYSLRHTFQFRIENAGASDRMQADLMGHEFGRPTYGDGAELKRRQEFLAGIAFEVGWAI